MGTRAVDDLRGRWERFAADDPMFFITGWDRPWTREEFLASGREIVGWFDEWLAPVAPGRMLEIGCGLGRTAIAWADRFEAVEAIDISPAMIEQAQSLGAPANVRFSVARGDGSLAFGDEEFDFVFSFVVFQHIPDARVLERYAHEIGRVLRPGATALLQYDTRAAGPVALAYGAMPDALMPAARRRGMRRFRRSPKWLRATFEAAGLAVRAEQGERSDKHWFLLEARQRA